MYGIHTDYIICFQYEGCVENDNPHADIFNVSIST